MLRKITLPLVAAGFVFVGMFGAAEDSTDARTAAVSPTMVPSPTAGMPVTPIPFGSATVTPIPHETATVTPTPPDAPEYPRKGHPAPTTTP